jgi:hypothetical protein
VQLGNEEEERSLSPYLINHRTITGWRDGLAAFLSSLQPGFLGNFYLGQGLLWCLAKARARIQIRNVCDVTAVLFAKENIDVIFSQGESLLYIVFLYQLNIIFSHQPKKLANFSLVPKCNLGNEEELTSKKPYSWGAG